MRKANTWYRIREWQRKRDGWWWWTEMIRNTKSYMRKFVPQVRCGIPEKGICI